MSPVLKLCAKHGTYRPGSPSIPAGKCPDCYRADNRRRAAKQRAHGRTSMHWQRLKAEAKRIANYRCENCGRSEERWPGGWLSVHLKPGVSRDHRLAQLGDVAVLCLSCHGSLDAPRAHESHTGGGSL
jgi:hypothetical protein